MISTLFLIARAIMQRVDRSEAHLSLFLTNMIGGFLCTLLSNVSNPNEDSGALLSIQNPLFATWASSALLAVFHFSLQKYYLHCANQEPNANAAPLLDQEPSAPLTYGALGRISAAAGDIACVWFFSNALSISLTNNALQKSFFSFDYWPVFLINFVLRASLSCSGIFSPAQFSPYNENYVERTQYAFQKSVFIRMAVSNISISIIIFFTSLCLKLNQHFEDRDAASTNTIAFLLAQFPSTMIGLPFAATLAYKKLSRREWPADALYADEETLARTIPNAACAFLLLPAALFYSYHTGHELSANSILILSFSAALHLCAVWAPLLALKKIEIERVAAR